jgi:hypothetical protein
MSQLKTALVICVAVLAGGIGEAQEAKTHSPISLFDLFDGLVGPDQMIDPNHRVPAIDLRGDDGDPDKTPPVKLGDDDWSFDASDGTWHQTTDEPTWHEQTAKPWRADTQTPPPFSEHSQSPWSVETGAPSWQVHTLKAP